MRTSLEDKFKDVIKIHKLEVNQVEISILHPDKQIHKQILFNFYNELYLEGYNTKVTVI